MLNVDLHCHSNVSDGLLAPAEVVARAAGRGVHVLALTDHDSVGGLSAAAESAARHGLGFVPGVEISVTWAGRTLHVLGLRLDASHPALLAGLEAIREGRLVRGRAIGAELERHGIAGAFEGACAQAENLHLLGRTHFARHLVHAGHAADVRGVFRKYLTPGKPGYVPHEWTDLASAVGWIHAAGGVPVIAHPGRYGLNPTQLGGLFDEFKELGGAGIEVVTGSHAPAQYAEFARHCRHYGFLASRGSDFHAPGEGERDLGGVPPLPSDLVPVWHDWPEALQGAGVAAASA